MSINDILLQKIRTIIGDKARFESGKPYMRPACYDERRLPDTAREAAMTGDYTIADEEAWEALQKCRSLDDWICPIHLVGQGDRWFFIDVSLGTAPGGNEPFSLAEIKLRAELMCQSLNQSLKDTKWCLNNIPILLFFQ